MQINENKMAILMGLNQSSDQALDSFLILSVNIQALAGIIICYIWLGLTETAAITAVALNIAPMVAVTLREALYPQLPHGLVSN